MKRTERVSAIVTWIVATGAATAVVLLFTLEGAPNTDDAALDETEALIEEGRAVYAQHCASCHGDDGQGGQGPPLAGTVVAAYPDAAEEIAVVVAGRNAMPSFALTLDDREIAAVVAFTRFALP